MNLRRYMPVALALVLPAGALANVVLKSAGTTKGPVNTLDCRGAASCGRTNNGSDGWLYVDAGPGGSTQNLLCPNGGAVVAIDGGVSVCGPVDAGPPISTACTAPDFMTGLDGSVASCATPAGTGDAGFVTLCQGGLSCWTDAGPGGGGTGYLGIDPGTCADGGVFRVYSTAAAGFVCLP